MRLKIHLSLLLYSATPEKHIFLEPPLDAYEHVLVSSVSGAVAGTSPLDAYEHVLGRVEYDAGVGLSIIAHGHNS